jgi:GT2 family glycosyltransferase
MGRQENDRMSRAAPILSIIIVNWNSWGVLRNCLESLRQHAAAVAHEIIVIDNHSADESVAHLPRDYPEVSLLALDTNVGFPKANNLGFAQAHGKYFLALNPDTTVHPGAIQESIQFLERHADYACVGVKTLKTNGQVQFCCARQYPTVRGVMANILMLDKVLPGATWLQSVDLTFWDHQDSRDVDMLAGSYMMFRRAIFETLGGLDERVLMFLEDVEFCLRLRKHGYRIRYLGTVSITHHVGQSTAKATPRPIAELRYKAWQMVIQECYGPRVAKQFTWLLLPVLTLKLLLLPPLCLGIYFKNRENRLVREVSETVFALFWAAGTATRSLLNRAERGLALPDRS